jgi:integrase
VAVGPRAQRLIEDYLDAAGHRADLEGPLFRPVKNNSTGLLAKPLNPQSLYESIVLHYVKKVGITNDTHGFCVHSLRATATTNSLQNGADIAEVQQKSEKKRGQTRMALPESQAALANRSRACWRGTVIRGYGLGRRLRTRGS